MIKSILIFSLMACSTAGMCQSSVSDQLSSSMAKKMSDSLGLTTIQKNRVQEINNYLAAQKQSAFEKYNDRDSLRIYLQRIENMRDSLYKEALPDATYLLYKEKKRNLINNR